MSKTVSNAVKTALSEDVTQISTCWKITLTSTSPETVLGFTDYDADLTVDGVVYNASSGYTASAVENVPDLEVGNLEVQGLLDSVYITEEDIFQGLYDGAEFEIFWYLRDDDESIPLMRGFFGEIKMQDGKFVAELRALTQILENQIGEKYTYLCRADFGDERCTLDAEALRVSGTVDTLIDDYGAFTIGGGGSPTGQYRYGILTWITGNNAGLSAGIKSYQSGLILLAVPTPFPIQAGDSFTMIPGCDKSWETCSHVYANLDNFRGEPYVPGTDELLDYPPLEPSLVTVEGEYGQGGEALPIGD